MDMKCLECNEAEIPEPELCCSGHMCGCMGLPIDPPYCDECREKLIKPKATKESEQNE